MCTKIRYQDQFVYDKQFYRYQHIIVVEGMEDISEVDIRVINAEDKMDIICIPFRTFIGMGFEGASDCIDPLMLLTYVRHRITLLGRNIEKIDPSVRIEKIARYLTSLADIIEIYGDIKEKPIK